MKIYIKENNKNEKFELIETSIDELMKNASKYGNYNYFEGSDYILTKEGFYYNVALLIDDEIELNNEIKNAICEFEKYDFCIANSENGTFEQFFNENEVEKLEINEILYFFERD